MDTTALLQSPEGKALEFKQDLSSYEKILRTLVAFANTAGGTLVIGVEDKTKNVIGIEEPLSIEERLANIISDGISPTLIPTIEISPWRKTYLILVEVYPSNNRPHYLKSKGLEKGTYIRIGSTNRLADAGMISELQRVTRSEAYDEQPMTELNSEAIDFIAASELFSEYRNLKKSDLETLKILTKYQGRYVPTIGGIILFGNNREKYFPDAWIQAGRFKEKDKQHIIDFQEIHSYPAIAVSEAISFLQKHLMQAIEISAAKRSEKWSVPIIAIREAVINAVAHADYSQRGSPIRIAIFDDRIEIENPGLIPFNLTLDDLYRGISKLRNPVIGRVFHELKLIERWGSGIRRIIEACSDAGLEKPLFEELGIHFRVTIFTEKKHSSSISKLDKIDQAILALLEKNEGLSTQQIANKINRSARATRSRLIELVKNGLIVEIGTGPRDPKKKYFLAK
ncbi:MAG: winged helix-turn-helix transcriptional regulator [Gammaproteobacteria bacterium]|nr:MAG: winged helix-turn-helix transcriptional regulator [Gammaproteobacteria bacterium]